MTSPEQPWTRQDRDAPKQNLGRGWQVRPGQVHLNQVADGDSCGGWGWNGCFRCRLQVPSCLPPVGQPVKGDPHISYIHMSQKCAFPLARWNYRRMSFHVWGIVSALAVILFGNIRSLCLPHLGRISITKSHTRTYKHLLADVHACVWFPYLDGWFHSKLNTHLS